jgi:hypothetical protein
MPAMLASDSRIKQGTTRIYPERQLPERAAKAL